MRSAAGTPTKRSTTWVRCGSWPGSGCGLRFEVGLLEAPVVRLHPHRQPRAGGAEPDGGGIGLGK
jgi:hypothetical protein